MADQAINALSTKTAPETSDQLLLVGAGEPQLIDYDKLADAILNKITSKNYALDAGQMTLLAALNKLNSDKAGNFNIITTNVTTGAQYGDFNVYFGEKTYTEIPALIINPCKVQGVNIVLNNFLYINNPKQINGVKLQAERSGSWYVSKAITITIATLGK